MRRLLSVSFLSLSFLVCSLVYAIGSPVALLQGVADTMITQLKANQNNLTPSIVEGIVRNNLVPHVDTVAMARSVVGRSYWMKATSADQQRFINEFKTLVIHNYSVPMASYNGDTVTFMPLRVNPASQERIQVKSQIHRSNGETIPISYRVINSAGKWLIYDFTVEGVSMVQSYRSQFASTLSSGGLSALADKLNAHNTSIQ